MNGGMFDPDVMTYRPRAALPIFWTPRKTAIGRWDWRFHTIIVLVPRWLEL